MKFKYCFDDSSFIYRHMGFIKGICFFGVLFAVLFVASIQLQGTLFSQINESQQQEKQTQINNRLIQNEFRNQTTNYLGNITQELKQHDIKINNLEQKVTG